MVLFQQIITVPTMVAAILMIWLSYQTYVSERCMALETAEACGLVEKIL